MSGGAIWGEGKHFSFIEQKHETGYCLELFAFKVAGTPIKRGDDDCFVYEWIDSHALIERMTVQQIEELAESLTLWAKTMREGGHYKEE